MMRLKIRSSDNPLSLYLKLISFAGMVTTCPNLFTACMEIKISLNSFGNNPHSF